MSVFSIPLLIILHIILIQHPISSTMQMMPRQNKKRKSQIAQTIRKNARLRARNKARRNAELQNRETQNFNNSSSVPTTHNHLADDSVEEIHPVETHTTNNRVSDDDKVTDEFVQTQTHTSNNPAPNGAPSLCNFIDRKISTNGIKLSYTNKGRGY